MLPKDTKWHIKSTLEAIQIFFFVICLVGAIICLIAVCFLPEPEMIGSILGWFTSVGFVNFLFLISSDSKWRQDYEDEEEREQRTKRGY